MSRTGDLDVERRHPFVVREAQQFRERPQGFLPALHDGLAGIRIEDVVIARRLEQPYMLAHNVQVPAQQRMHGPLLRLDVDSR